MTNAAELPDNVLSRIHKLLAMTTGRGASEAEAQTAAEKVQSILQDYGMTMAQIEATGGETGTDGKREKKTSDRRAMYRWQVSLMESLAANNFCIHMVETVYVPDKRKIMRRSKRHVLIGRVVNVIVTLDTYDYLCKAVRRAADDHGYDHAENERDHHIFLEGAVNRLGERLTEKRQLREQEEAAARKEREAVARHPSAAPATPGTALVLSDVYQNEAELNEDLQWGRKPGTTTRLRLEREQRLRDFEARVAALREQGIEWDVAWYMANGRTREQAEELYEEEKKRNARAEQRSSRSYGPTAEDRRRWDREAAPAFSDGRKAGGKIGLDTQIGGDAARRIKS